TASPSALADELEQLAYEVEHLSS
nr:Chain A, Lac23ys_aEE, an acidic mutant of LacI C-terminal tetramerization helix [Escherichia coli]8GOI_C Chain C, Lac23ys_aEE, an acidic mutant of LacI C-terminal tetramerization helix [Escherichia coli]8GOI_E Chain E, Lac23ys_aEE, an acidic mutant of LacI C-terminal tetramerization helix [Escherichia coli]8GOI_G Chain G, Lac23ys_aEE, an acidic mutant of LacI C-terminal tetramerization helix [Escherichia coli]